MKFIQLFFTITLLTLANTTLVAQTPVQTIRGTISDGDSKMPLIGANVIVLGLESPLGSNSDMEGYFKIEQVPVGRVNLRVSYLGYETANINEVLLTSGKELVLNIELTESTNDLGEVLVVAKHDKTSPLNEMASVSARSFSVEETSRYAASFFDPARMALNYAGVSTGGGTDDLNNEIIVRGNSPKGVLWRMEGVEIPNPNHFSELGNSGGGISMLSSSTLANSDFYTGAFPSEFGNAVSGVFDLKLRNGNNENREYAFMFSILGLEAALEGPFKKGSNASYLINYRYSTLSLMRELGISPVDDDDSPTYQDLSFKFNWPTKKAGTFALFGLGGINGSKSEVVPDSSLWNNGSSNPFGYDEGQTIGTVGLSHRLLLGNNSYLNTVMIVSNDVNRETDYFLVPGNDYKRQDDYVEKFTNRVFRVSSTYTKKINAQHTFRTGAIFSYQHFRLTLDEFEESIAMFDRLFDNKGGTTVAETFAQWKYRINGDWTLNTGFHASYMDVNQQWLIEPRMALQWQVNPKHRLSAAIGLHSKAEHIAFYIASATLPDGQEVNPNQDLGMTRAFHAVLGHDFQITQNLRLKTEVYYQHLFDVPVVNQANSFVSSINALDVFDLIGVDEYVNDGLARNYGIDLTLEKFFSRGIYFLVTGSVFESKFTPKDGKEYNTRFNSNYQVNVLLGKEFKVGKKKNKIFGVNAKFIANGGNRQTPINLEASANAGFTVFDFENVFGERLQTYLRLDLGLKYQINSKNRTHSIRIDIQNLTNRQNIQRAFYNSRINDYSYRYQTGFLPVFSYRLEF